MSVDASNVIIRAATKQEVIEHFHAAVQAVGWQPAVIDSRIYAESAAPGGVFIAVHNDTQLKADGGDVATKDILGCIAAYGHGTASGYIGHFIVREDARGLGIGGKLFDRALEHLRDCETIGLDAVLQMEPYYAKRGFIRVYETARYVSTTVPDLTKDWNPAEESARLIQGLGDEYEIVDPRAHVDAVTEYESSISRMTRPGHIQALLFATVDEPSGDQLNQQQQQQQQQQQHGHTHVSLTGSVVVALRHKPSGKIVSFGAIRPGTSPYARIAPLYANSHDLAVKTTQILLLSYYSRLGEKSQKAFLDVIADPSESARISAFVNDVSSSTKWTPAIEVVRFARMWTNGLPKDQDPSRIYALLSVEQG
ncbi:hypothetical protein GQ42DRAFT_59002 [Ramicandelaber brevisporus]|nr:hypothetical protein GQ42DRAFT_59002 [Ramicandelaber brevisporus]